MNIYLGSIDASTSFCIDIGGQQGLKVVWDGSLLRFNEAWDTWDK
jgi:hypothetical protein